MKTILRVLSLTGLLVVGNGVVSQLSQAATVVVSPTNIIDTKIKVALYNYGEATGLTNLTFQKDSQTDFRIYSNGQFIEYGYYDSSDDGVWIAGENYHQ
ncbi:hypothetical protein [Hymenobacter cellulosilyticus]|uniref:Uncharacterized protein n=1 Tax=Hymenobacter cellulosilyticus TaxID=2932248 RepID=A0A8T9QB55_9BACT|nr:hypothetical protein [Hymenobacter cellulosilyticus]UOQ72759.1 hypothetical protein MUN79_01845 [Hymenobacter cellulosilyticus]